MSDIIQILQSIDNCRTDDALTDLNAILKQRKAEFTAEEWQRIVSQGHAMRAWLAKPEYPMGRAYPLLIPDYKNTLDKDRI